MPPIGDIYTERLSPQYSNWSYACSSLSLASTSQPRMGRRAIRAKLSRFGAMSFRRDYGAAWDKRVWRGMEFWVASDRVASIDVVLEVARTRRRSRRVPVTSLFVWPAEYAGV